MTKPKSVAHLPTYLVNMLSALRRGERQTIVMPSVGLGARNIIALYWIDQEQLQFIVVAPKVMHGMWEALAPRAKLLTVHEACAYEFNAEQPVFVDEVAFKPSCLTSDTLSYKLKACRYLIAYKHAFGLWHEWQMNREIAVPF